MTAIHPSVDRAITALPQTSVRRKLALATLIVGAGVLCAEIAVGVSTVDVVSNTNSQVNRYNPALVRSEVLMTALLNQESGLRGFVATHDPQFLQPYTDGVQVQKSTVAELHRLVGKDRNVNDALNNLVAAVDVWQAQTAAARYAQALAGIPQSLPDAQADKARFDAIRVAQADLATRLQTVRDKANRARINATRDLERLLLFMAVFFVALVGLAFRATTVWVVEPLLRLRDETRRVVTGSFDHKVEVEGPREVRELAQDVEAMRQRITAELAEVDRARDEIALKAAALEQSNTDLEQFAYVASHDLQEPLRKVSNFCQLLERQYSAQLDDRAREYIGFAVDGARRMQLLIQDLLAFSRVGRTTDNFEPVPLSSIVTDALSTLEDEIKASEGYVSIEGSLPVVSGDPRLLTALFQNLIGNALKYRGDKPPFVSVSYEGIDEDGMHLIQVSDNGIGIDPVYADRIFVIFQRLHTRDAYTGTGIGLAICKKIVEYHSGRIWLDTERTGGARFWFTLPAGAANE